jgi:hypothetical protein
VSAIAAMVRRMAAAKASPEMVALAVEGAERAISEVLTAIRDPSAERRRAYDRERKRNPRDLREALPGEEDERAIAKGDDGQSLADGTSQPEIQPNQ